MKTTGIHTWVGSVSKTDSSGTSVGYPIFDGHGNRTATLTKSGASFSLADVRTYDAWGAVRAGAQTGRPRARYCANLGHVQDDESGLVYMRDRYYEPTSGRFVSQDPARNGSNWFRYCENDPVNKVDQTGKIAWSVIDVAAIVFGVILMALAIAVTAPVWVVVALAVAGGLCTIVGAYGTEVQIVSSFVESWAQRPAALGDDAIAQGVDLLIKMIADVGPLAKIEVYNCALELATIDAMEA